MTTREALKLPAWAGWLGPILIAGLIGLGAAKATLGGKEDSSAHSSDVKDVRAEQTAVKVELQGDIKDLRNEAVLRAVRDSARDADVMRILLDIQRKVNR